MAVESILADDFCDIVLHFEFQNGEMSDFGAEKGSNSFSF